MKRFAIVSLWISLVLILLIPNWHAVSSPGQVRPAPISPGGIHVPDGFHLVMQDAGVQLFRKDYPNGTPDYVEVIRLDQGAAIQLMHGDITETRPGKGAYGGDDPRFLSHTLQQYWNDFSSTESTAFCVTNGQFFYMKEYPTRLPFPLKVDGKVISEGYGIDQFLGKKLMLEIWGDHAQISHLSQESLYNSTAPDIVSGLAEDAPKNIKKYVGRTFVGVLDQDGNGESETVLLFNTRTARQVDAAGILYSFGASRVMMLDGGGSTQLICKGQPLITTDRYIPQALGVLAASPENEIIQTLAIPDLLQHFKVAPNIFSTPTPEVNKPEKPAQPRPARNGPKANLQHNANQPSQIQIS